MPQKSVLYYFEILILIYSIHSDLRITRLLITASQNVTGESVRWQTSSADIFSTKQKTKKHDENVLNLAQLHSNVRDCALGNPKLSESLADRIYESFDFLHGKFVTVVMMREREK